jgi:fatty-acid desaturase
VCVYVGKLGKVVVVDVAENDRRRFCVFVAHTHKMIQAHEIQLTVAHLTDIIYIRVFQFPFSFHFTTCVNSLTHYMTHFAIKCTFRREL